MKRLIAKGISGRYRVGFKVKGEDRILHAPTGYDLLHAPEGGAWPRCSLLVMPFDKQGEKPTDAEVAGAPRDYLGRDHRIRASRLDASVLPPKELAAWSRVGVLEAIYYFRPGTKAPGWYRHPIGKRTLFGLFRKGTATLYERAGAYRVELGKGCKLDERGILYP